jgi:hypothetical protein
MLKTCSTCGSEKPLDEFHEDPGHRDGRCSLCKLCATAKTARWRSENTERCRDYERSRYSDARRAFSREYNRAKRAGC